MTDAQYIRCKHGMVTGVGGRCNGCYIEELEANLKSALDHIEKDDVEIADLNTKLEAA